MIMFPSLISEPIKILNLALPAAAVLYSSFRACYTDKRVEVSVTTGFLWNHLATDYEKRVEDLLCNFKAMGCRMSQKLHVLHFHLNVFKGRAQNFPKLQRSHGVFSASFNP